MSETTMIQKKIEVFINQYLQMDYEGIKFHCPYWVNIIRDQKIFRGFKNGKGQADEILKELSRRLSQQDKKFIPDEQFIYKIAKRYRIGIDCSGLVYRIIDLLLKSGYGNSGRKTAEEFYSTDILKTNAARLTSFLFMKRIDDVSKAKFGDLIRMMGGKHVVFILENSGGKITYIHSSHLTEIKGVHLGEILLKSMNLYLDKQSWKESAKKGENFGKNYFQPEKGDCIVRPKFLI